MSEPRPKPGQDGQHHTFCRLCEAFCGLTVDVTDGRMTRISTDRHNPHSRGHACVKGTSALELTYDPDRVLAPLRRVGGPGEFEPVSWEQALSEIARKLAKTLQDHGSDAVANYIGNPAAFSNGGQVSIRAFLNHFGVWKTFGSATQDITARMMASFIAYGSALRIPIPDLPRCDFLLVVGANPLVSHGSALTAPRMREDLDAIAQRGRVVVVDPRATETARRYEHVPIMPDTDVWLLAAMINTLFDEGLVDAAAFDAVSGLDEFRSGIAHITPELAERYCGVPARQIVQLARDFRSIPRAAVYSRVGICRGSFAALAVLLIDALNILAGKFGVVGGSVFGDTPIDIARTRSVKYELRETRFGLKPYIANNLHFSQLADEILMPGEGRVRALLMESGNFLLSAPGGETLERALGELDLFVSHDLYMNETNRHAHYILPGPTFLERADVPVIGFAHMVRPFAQFSDAVIPQVGDTLNEHDIFNELGARLHAQLRASPGASGYSHEAAPFFDPLAAIDANLRDGGATVNIDGKIEPLCIDLLKQHPHGVVVAEALTCTNSLSKVLTADGRIGLWHPCLDDEVERLRSAQPPAEGELRLFSMRSLKGLNSWLHNIDKLVRSLEPALMMHPVDALNCGVTDGGRAKVTSVAGSVEVAVRVTAEVVRGAVCYPHGLGHRGGSWQRANAAGGVNINILADLQSGDRLSASSLLDGIIVQVEHVAAEMAVANEPAH